MTAAAAANPVVYLVPTDASPERRVLRNAPFNDEGALYAFGDAIGLGQAGVFIDRSGAITFTVGNAVPGTTLRIGVMSSKRRRVIKALEVPVLSRWTFGNCPRDVRASITITATDCRRMGIAAGVKLAVQAIDEHGVRGDITWFKVWTEEEIRPRHSYS